MTERGNVVQKIIFELLVQVDRAFSQLCNEP